VTRVLVVHHDSEIADQEVDALRRVGYALQQCAGPMYGPCPVLAGLRCPAVDEAHVLVLDAGTGCYSESGPQLIEQLRALYPDLPIVLTSAEADRQWLELADRHAIVLIEAAPTGPRLRTAVNRALDLVRVPA
jgi:DNA-binding NtrC family response regulator